MSRSKKKNSKSSRLISNIILAAIPVILMLPILFSIYLDLIAPSTHNKVTGDNLSFFEYYSLSEEQRNRLMDDRKDHTVRIEVEP